MKFRLCLLCYYNQSFHASYACLLRPNMNLKKINAKTVISDNTYIFIFHVDCIDTAQNLYLYAHSPKLKPKTKAKQAESRRMV